ncbi:MAG: PrpR N-terminal domain-containing protein, partial [Atopobiaceae bacterium]|nr:PrpR N-terminal domain-containing protein [Atopobiaceae bacterium]
NLDEGVRAAIDHLLEPYDLILSRGGTADLLRKELDLPVLDIKTSAFDVLQAVQLSEGISGKRAVVGFSGITDAARTTSDVLQLGLDIFTLVDEGDVHDVTKLMREQGYSTVLCDVISSTVFREAGFNTILVTSGAESVRDSIDEAIRTARHIGKARDENAFLREVIRNHGGDTVIFHEDGSLFFTTLDRGGSEQIVSSLRDLIPEVSLGDADSLRRTVGGQSYAIKTFSHVGHDGRKTVFYLTKARASTSSRQAGITYYSKADARKEYLDSPFSLIGNLNNTSQAVKDVVNSGKPLLATGEYGTGRTAIALYAYVNSSRASRPLAEVDCALLTDRSRDSLLNGRNSPLFDDGLTIHFKNIESCSDSFVHELFSTLVDAEVIRRNYVIFSGDPLKEDMAARLMYIKDKFQCMEVELSPLRESKERIPTVARLYLSQLNADLPKEVLRIDRQAMELLSDYAWPGNYVQFKRVLSQLCAGSRDHTIRASDVRAVLSMERPVYQEGPTHAIGDELDLGRPLADIERDIVELVVRRCGGNQSAAARQLGLSRTTLWRLTKSS